MNENKLKSLRIKLLFTALLALTVAALVFMISFTIGSLLLDHTVYGRSFAQKTADTQATNLQAYINKESVSLENLRRLNVWCSRGDKVYLAIYHEDELVFDSQVSKNVYPETDPEQEDPQSEYILTLADGTEVRAFLYYYAGDAFYLWMTVISGILAFIGFSLCFVFLVNKKVSYITRLQEELEILSGGQLEYQITVSGEDELSELALGIDQMRKSIIKHQETEKQMRTANSELITSMSHDLRTPLTSLLAYLEILERKKYADEVQMQNLIHKSLGQTMRIRDMADKLFQYFFVYATEWENAEMESVDADMLFSQILEDYASALESKGIRVERKFSEVSANINVNTELLQRALDNLYSNLIKYADTKRFVTFSYQRSGNKLLLTILNGITPDREKKDSTQIGLCTCRRIIEFHGGTFTASEKGTLFSVILELPLTVALESK